MRVLFRSIVGLVFGLFSGMALVPASAAFMENDGTRGTWLVWAAIAVGILLGAFAPTIRRAFGRGFLLLGASVFVLPISTLLLSSRVTHDLVANAANGADKAAVALGSGFAGAMLTGASAFIGFFVGAIFLLIGLVLVLGGRREVIVVQR